MRLKPGQLIGTLEVIEIFPNLRANVKCRCGTVFNRSIKSLMDKRPNKTCGTGECNSRRADLAGRVYNGLLVIDDKASKRDVKLRCFCGREFTRHRYDVTHNKIKNCGVGLCNSQIKDLTNMVFGYLTAQKMVKGRRPVIYWECRCKCGKIVSVPSNKLLMNHTKSCGCFKIEKITNLNLIPAEEVMVNTLLSKYKDNAKKAKVDFYLTKEEFRSFLHKNCFYCGDPPKNKHSLKRKSQDVTISYSGIDKIDPYGGYVIENCVSCCVDCNFAKRKMTQDEFITLARKISSRFPI